MESLEEGLFIETIIEQFPCIWNIKDPGHKVALILGTTGALRAHELHDLNIDDFTDHGSAVVVRVHIFKKNIPRHFTVTGHFYDIWKKYVNLRPSNAKSRQFFLCYRYGKCIPQNIGINTFRAMGKHIAKFLKLPDPDMYKEFVDGDLSVCSILTLPEKSRKAYDAAYKTFMNWKTLKDEDFSEKLMLEYFEELSKNYSSTSLWAYYSMLRSTIHLYNKVSIEQYIGLRKFLKEKSKGYEAKKAKIFTSQDIYKFLVEAPDEIYLATKVALILGTAGGCGVAELRAMTVEDFQDFGSAVVVTVHSQYPREFTITGFHYDIWKAYASLRPPTATSSAFFLNYQKGQCTIQNIGKNKIGLMIKQIAKYLKLPNPELYSGHSFRRSVRPLTKKIFWGRKCEN